MSKPDSVLDSLRTILTYAQQGDLTRARDQIIVLTRAHPDHAEVHGLAGILAREDSDIPGATMHLKRAMRLSPEQSDHGMALSKLLLDNGDLQGSVTTVRAVLETNPSEVRGWQLLARGLTRLRQLDDAHNALKSALALSPADPALLYQIGNICFQQREYAAAAAHFETAHTGLPEKPEILNDLGSAYLALGRVDDAVTVLQKAIQTRPDFAMAYANLGGALAYRGEMNTPLRAFLKATQLAPRDHRIWLKMGRTLLNQGHLETAEKCFHRVLVAKPENRAAQAALGTLFERTGRYTKALQILHPLIEANLQDANAIVAWATACRRLGQSERAIPNLQRFLEGPRAQPEKVLLIHTLGDLYDNCGQHKEAFEAHKTANQLHGLSFDPERFSRSIDQIIEAFPASSFGRRSRASRTDSSPVLIVGMPRSGTSLVEQIIDSHAQAAGAGELETLRQISGVLSRNAGKVDWNTSMDSMDSALADKLSEAYLSKLRETDSTAIRITDKMPINFLNLGMAAQILPGARVIHCTRDPLDTALSCYFKLFNFGYAFSTRLSWLGHFTLGYLRLMAHWDQVLPLPTLQVRYESLVEDLDTGARRIVDFLDLPWDENCLRFHENTRQVNTASYAQVRRPIYRSSLGRAQDYLEWLGPLRDVLDR